MVSCANREDVLNSRMRSHRLAGVMKAIHTALCPYSVPSVEGGWSACCMRFHGFTVQGVCHAEAQLEESEKRSDGAHLRESLWEHVMRR